MELWTNKKARCKTQIYAYEGRGALKMDKNTMWRTQEITDKDIKIVRFLRALFSRCTFSPFYRKGGNQKSLFIFLSAVIAVFLCCYRRVENRHFKASDIKKNLIMKQSKDFQITRYLQEPEEKYISKEDSVFPTREFMIKNYQELKDTYYEYEKEDANAHSDLIKIENWNGTLTPVLFIKSKNFKKLQFQTRTKNRIRLKLEAKRERKGLHPYKVWENQEVSDEDCNDIRFLQIISSNVNKVVLGSYPGSGNTWMRHMIHLTTGVWTSSVYFDRKIFQAGYSGETHSCDDKGVLIFKVHNLEHALAMNCTFERAVLIIRNPFRAVLSEFNRQSAKDHTGYAKEETFKNGAWSSFAANRSWQWMTQIQSWLEMCDLLKKKIKRKACVLVRYEHLLKNPIEQTERVLKFLNLSTKRLKCLNTKSNIAGYFRRSDKDQLDNLKKASCSLSENARQQVKNAMNQLSATSTKLMDSIEASSNTFKFEEPPPCQLA